jgi:two-component system sensor histidine kinase CpxA
MPGRPVILLLHADRLDGSGMFFEFKPWLWGGIAVLGLSLAFWTPFVWSITRYLRRLTAAADLIASGRFQVSLPPRGNDELGNLGRAVESMAARLDHLVSGQKRFLGDAAHELCAPLARIRTALGVLETRGSGTDPTLLSSIEADTTELATLVDEILSFSRTGNREPTPRAIDLEILIREVLARESAEVESVIRVPHGLTVMADPTLLGRALGNLVRNAAIHAGPHAHVEIEATEAPDAISISVTDNGPGVPADELAGIFEPFHRLDRARSRETGGSGLGLAIVRSAVEACGGEVHASLPAAGGLRVTLRLPKGRGGPASA